MDEVGARLRQARTTRRPPLTLADVAGDQLSIGLVSKIERGKVSPSLGTLQYLARRLEVPLSALLGEVPDDVDALRLALPLAQSRLLLGDPAGAAAACVAALERLPVEPGTGDPPPPSPAGPGQAAEAAVARARLLALLAEAQLVAGTGSAAASVAAGAEALARCRAAGNGARDDAPSAPPAATTAALAEAELARVFGLLERRRGRLAAAGRAWTRCLDVLEPWPVEAIEASWLRARVLAEHGSVNRSSGALETAHNFLTRARALFLLLADPLWMARAALPDAGGTPAAPLALSILAAAGRLAGQAEQELAGLERSAAVRQVAAPVVPVSHSRHLR